MAPSNPQSIGLAVHSLGLGRFRFRTMRFATIVLCGAAGLVNGCGRDTDSLKSGSTRHTGGAYSVAGTSSLGGSSGGATGIVSQSGGTLAASAGAGVVSNGGATAGSGSLDNLGGTGNQAGASADGLAGSLGTNVSGGQSSGGSNGTSVTAAGSGAIATGGGIAFGGSAGAMGIAGAAGSSSNAPSAIYEAVDVGLTYSGQPTDMSLITIGNQQFVGYWGDTKFMTVASRLLTEKTWKKVTLAPQFDHDGHLSIVMAADKAGYLHLSGRMHNNPLTYLRSTAPMDITTFQLQMAAMVNAADEQSCTYPRFFVGPIGDLVFSYRSGVSGQGDTIFNVYNAATKTWRRLLGTKLIDGGGANSAYIVGPVKGPDDYWHMVWTWRVDANCETNHDLSYARTKDFEHWESGTGAPLTLPITLTSADIVDPVPVNGGMINNNTKVGFDSQNRPVVVYHKFDQSGATQLYNARIENGVWVTHQTTNWGYRWYFAGMNTINFEIEVDGVRPYPNGQLKQLYYHAKNGGWGGLLVNETTLTATETIPPPYPYPKELQTVESTTPGMHTRWWPDAGSGPDPDVYYMMRWETLDPNGDQPRNPEPPPTTLRVYGFRRSVMMNLK
ncbi:MAG TPA: BNR repeat-containing protein [Polyangiaceae bacterium]